MYGSAVCYSLKRSIPASRWAGIMQYKIMSQLLSGMYHGSTYLIMGASCCSRDAEQARGVSNVVLTTRVLFRQAYAWDGFIGYEIDPDYWVTHSVGTRRGLYPLASLVMGQVRYDGPIQWDVRDETLCSSHVTYSRVLHYKWINQKPEGFCVDNYLLDPPQTWCLGWWWQGKLGWRTLLLFCFLRCCAARNREAEHWRGPCKIVAYH